MFQYDRIPSPGRSVLRAGLSWGAFVTALAAASLGATAWEASVEGGPTALSPAVPAVIMLALTVPLVLVVHRRSPDELGLARPARAFWGLAVIALSSGVVLAPALAAGWITVTSADLARLSVFLLTNTLLALALEAVPEELAFRGSVHGSLRTLIGPVRAGVVATAAFVVAPAAGIALAAWTGRLTGVPTPPPTFAPGGQDPVAYGVLLAVFGAVLILAREATASLWTAVGVHLSFLTVNRLFFGGDAFDTGLTTVTAPGSELLVLAYLLLAGLAFVILRRAAPPRRVAVVSGPRPAGP